MVCQRPQRGNTSAAAGAQQPWGSEPIPVSRVHPHLHGTLLFLKDVKDVITHKRSGCLGKF